MNDSERIYMDWAAASPLLPEAKAAMLPWLTEHYGNPSAIHAEGVQARVAVETAREQVAAAVQARPEQITFTGGGTEGNNLAIFGVIETLRAAGRDYADMEVITTSIEHPSIGRAMERLQQLGVVVQFVAVDEVGLIILPDLQQKLSAKTVLVSCAYANSEIGTIQPVRQIKKYIQAAEQLHGTKIAFHIDAAQAPLWLSCQFGTVAADIVVLDVAKCCGPKGVGVVVASKRIALTPAVFGGGQESGLRPGTENVPGIVGAGVALTAAQAGWKERAAAVSAVRNAGITRLLEVLPLAVLNGASGEERLANNINISIPGLDTEFAAVVLDSKGFAVSTKSACAGAGGGESTVVKTISSDPARAASTLRFTLGSDTTVEQLQQLTEVLKQHVKQMALVQ